MPRWLRNNALTVAMLGAFLVFLVLQSVFGWQTHNEELAEFGAAPLELAGVPGHRALRRVGLRELGVGVPPDGRVRAADRVPGAAGSAESKPEDQTDRPEDDERRATPDSPWPVRVGGLPLMVYRNSLSIALLLIFAGSFVGHLLGGTAEYNEQQALQSGAPPIGAWQFLGTSEFWFQSMQNWQSEFLAVGALIVLSIFLRQHASPESKPVTVAHAQTGD